MSTAYNWDDDCLDWLEVQFDTLVDEVSELTPSEVAEKFRYLPSSSGSIAGPFRFDITPFWKEPLDCMGIGHPAREIAIMKGVQVGFTTAVLENTILYLIMEVKSAPSMLLTATEELAKLRLDTYVVPMLDHSGLRDVIISADAGNNRKTGYTKNKLEWRGGGFMLAYGAKSPSKMRSIPVRYLLRDENDSYAKRVGQDGDPMELTFSRTKNYERTRKVVDGSTPTLEGESIIYERFMNGDQRYYHVPCKKCGQFQKLEWNKVNKDTGETYGLHFEERDGQYVEGSVRYYCKHCGHPHTNEDKAWMFPRGKWIPSAKPVHPHYRSYHLSGLYSPPDMSSWDATVRAWFDAWDVANNKPKNIQKLQVFYNNWLGIPFKKQTDKLTIQHVSAHRRGYLYGEIPNYYASQYAESSIMLLICSVDVQQDELSTSIWGFTRGHRRFLIDYWQLKGDTSNIDDPTSWGALRQIIESKTYIADDDTEYMITATFIDSGKFTKTVYNFCATYEDRVYPIKGVTRAAMPEEFKQRTAKTGKPRFDINVDIYKDTLNEHLRAYWDEALGDQPEGHFNAPSNISNKQLKELTAEHAEVKLNPKTNQKEGMVWHRTKGVRNELWDLSVYAEAGLDIIAYYFYKAHKTPKGEEPEVNWSEFWTLCEENQLYFST